MGARNQHKAGYLLGAYTYHRISGKFDDVVKV